MQNILPRCAIIVPCYNEEEILPKSAKELKEYLLQLINKEKIAKDSFILFVDDGSKDKTLDIIKNLVVQDSNIFKYISLSRNFGHQNALIAGLTEAKDLADIFITIDADLQDDHRVIEEMILKFTEGYEVVLGVRRKRDTDSWFKKNTALFFYKLMTLLGAKIVENHADFRLLSKRAVNYLLEMKEVNLFLRGMVTYIGLNTTIVLYDRKQRMAGKSKYPFFKMLNFAFDGITSFSTVPLRLILYVGIIVFLFSLLMIIYTLASKFFGNTVKGWASTVLSLWFLGGIELMALGLIGEYLGKVYQEVKHRPRYLLKEKKI